MMTHDQLISFMKESRLTADDATALNVIGIYPHWEDNIGKTITNDDIAKGLNRYQHNGKLYRVVQETVFQEQFVPGAEGMSAIFVEVSLEEFPEWVQPKGAHDAYNTGDKVTHNGVKYVSDIDANVWEPGVYGWSVYVE